MKPEILLVGNLLPLLDMLEQHFMVHRLWEAADRDAFLREVGPRVRALATSGNPVFGASRELLEQLPALEMISVQGAGYDPVDMDTASRMELVVTTTPGAPAPAVGELALALMLALARNVCAGDRYVRAGLWPEQGAYPLGFNLRDKVCGVAGLGQCGRAVARMAEAVGMRVVYSSRSAKPDASWEHVPRITELAEVADFLVLCVPGGAQTRHMVNADVLRALGPEGWLINVSRGSVVDEAALVQALSEGVIAGAGLDVFAAEPHVPEELRRMDNVVLLPHMGSAARETRTAMARMALGNLLDYFAGRPLQNRVL